MRKYTYTLKEERKYVVGIDAESEQEADKILDRMGKKGVEKHLTEIVWSDIISVSKGDFFETPKKKAKKKTAKKTKK